MWGKTGSDSGDDSPNNATVIYIAGSGHSGSTVLSFVLNTHPEIFAIGEMHAPYFPADRPEERMCSCGRAIKTCPFFSSLEERFRRQGYAFDPCSWDLTYQFGKHPVVNRLLAGSLRNNFLEKLREFGVSAYPSYRLATETLDRMNALFIQSSLEITGKKVFVDATKDHMRISHLRRVMGSGLRVIHLVRDPRGYAVSVMKQPGGISLHQAISSWKRTNLNVERQLKSLTSDQKMLVQYEELCNRPEKVLAQIGCFGGVGPIAVPGDFRRAPHHIMGNRMRLSDSTGKLRFDSKWRRILNSSSVELIRDQVGTLGRSYGLDLTS